MSSTTTRSEFDIFAKATVQSAVLCSRVKHYKSITPVDQSDIEFVVPGGTKTYVDLGIQKSVHEDWWHMTVTAWKLLTEQS